MSALDSRLQRVLCWQLIVATERGAGQTLLREFHDQIDGQSLVLTSNDHPCELVLNDRRGLTINAPILIETLPWTAVATRQMSLLVQDVLATLAWPSQASWAPSESQLLHQVILQLLSAGLAEEAEYWVSSVFATSDSAPATEVGLFPTFADQLLEDFQRKALDREESVATEAWVIWRDAAPLAIFDSDMAMHTGTSRWSYRHLSEEVGGCPRQIAHHCFNVLASIEPPSKIFSLR